MSITLILLPSFLPFGERFLDRSIKGFVLQRMMKDGDTFTSESLSVSPLAGVALVLTRTRVGVRGGEARR